MIKVVVASFLGLAKAGVRLPLRLAAALLLVFSLAAASSAGAASLGEVAVVCDREVSPYRAVLDGFSAACNCRVRVISPEDAMQPGLEQRLKAQGVRAVLAVGIEAQRAVEDLRELPVVLSMVPQVAHWVAARPNRYGIEMALSPRQNLETLRRVFPRATRIGLIHDPGETNGYVREARAAASALGLHLETREISRPGDLSRRLEEIRRNTDVIWLLPDRTVLRGENLDQLLLASFESRLPLFAFARKYVDSGALAAALFDPAALGIQAAAILAGQPAARGVAAAPRWEYATGAKLVINQKVARKMGVEFDPAVLEGADVVR